MPNDCSVSLFFRETRRTPRGAPFDFVFELGITIILLYLVHTQTIYSSCCPQSDLLIPFFLCQLGDVGVEYVVDVILAGRTKHVGNQIYHRTCWLGKTTKAFEMKRVHITSQLLTKRSMYTFYLDPPLLLLAN